MHAQKKTLTMFYSALQKLFKSGVVTRFAGSEFLSWIECGRKE